MAHDFPISNYKPIYQLGITERKKANKNIFAN